MEQKTNLDPQKPKPDTTLLKLWWLWPVFFVSLLAAIFVMNDVVDWMTVCFLALLALLGIMQVVTFILTIVRKQWNRLVGTIVGECTKSGLVLDEVPMETYKSHSDLFDTDLYEDISLETCVKKRISQGGTGPDSVNTQLAYIKTVIDKYCN